MKTYFSNNWKNQQIWVRCFELIPSISIHLYQNWSFESIRISWLGLDFGLYRIC